MKPLVLASFLATLPFAFLASASTTPTSVKRQASSTQFTVRSYESPFPEGQGLTGYYLDARQGDFFLTKKAPSNPPVLSVNQENRGTLVKSPLPIPIP